MLLTTMPLKSGKGSKLRLTLFIRENLFNLKNIRLCLIKVASGVVYLNLSYF